MSVFPNPDFFIWIVRPDLSSDNWKITTSHRRFDGRYKLAIVVGPKQEITYTMVVDDLGWFTPYWPDPSYCSSPTELKKQLQRLPVYASALELMEALDLLISAEKE